MGPASCTVFPRIGGPSITRRPIGSSLVYDCATDKSCGDETWCPEGRDIFPTENAFNAFKEGKTNEHVNGRKYRWKTDKKMSGHRTLMAGDKPAYLSNFTPCNFDKENKKCCRVKKTPIQPNCKEWFLLTDLIFRGIMTGGGTAELAAKTKRCLSQNSGILHNKRYPGSELGEATGRRAAGMSSAGSFSLSAGSNRAGNDEEDEES